jgi:signal peptidase
MRLVRRTVIGAAGVATIVLVAFATALVGIRVAGYSTAVVMSGSMAPTIPMGSLIFVQPMAPAAARAGDIITFVLPDRLVTHRVVAVERDDGGLRLVTKGDANEAVDSGGVRAEGAIGAVRLAVPLAGYALAELQAWWRPLALALLVAIAVDALHRRIARRRTIGPAPAVA